MYKNSQLRRAIFFSSLMFSLLTIYSIISLKSTDAVLYPDSSRYLFPNLDDVLDEFGFSQGSLLPSFIFTLVQKPSSVFLINTLFWLVSWLFSYILFNVISNAGTLRWVLTGFVWFFLSTSSLVITMNRLVLVESLGISLMIICVSVLAALFVSTQSQQSLKTLLLAFILPFLLLAISKPIWAFCLGLPAFLLLIFLKKPFDRKSKLIGGLILAGAEIVLAIEVIVLQRAEYLYGLSFQGWSALTRALDLGQNATLSQYSSPLLFSCPGSTRILDEVQGNHSLLGLPAGFDLDLASCPDVLDQLNSGKYSLWGLFIHSPLGFTQEVFSRFFQIFEPSYYGVGDVEHWTLSLHDVSGGAIAVVLVAATILILFVLLKQKSFSQLLAFSILVINGILFAYLFLLQDGIEHGRHVAPMTIYLSLLILASVALVMSPTLNLNNNKKVQK